MQKEEQAIESFEELLSQSELIPKVSVDDILVGRVVEITNNSVIIDIGMKSESEVPKNQFYDENKELEVEVGSEAEVAVKALEDGNGQIRLSRTEAKKAQTWTMLGQALENRESVKANIKHKVKGGLAVEIREVKGFLPGSLIDIKTVRDFSYLEGTVQQVKLVKMDDIRGNVVVSRRAVIEEETSAEREALVSSMEEGRVIKGVVKNITDYGAFLDIGILDGLLHITDMAWRKISDPREIVEVGQELEVKILSFNLEQNRISLGLKQLQTDTWDDLMKKYPIGSDFEGKISKIVDYGLFIEIEEGIEGLVHTTEISWKRRKAHIGKLFDLGQKLKVRVLDIDKEKRRISLSLKATLENPWETFAQNYKKGDKITGIIKSITDFGIFIGLPGEIDGLIHVNDFEWESNSGGGKTEEKISKYKKGDSVEAMVLTIDAKKERISLGLKQLTTDPFSEYLLKHPKNSFVEGKVVQILSNGMVVELDKSVKGFVRINEITNESKVDKIEDFVSLDSTVSAKIMNVDRKNRKINLSIKAREAAEREQALKEYSANALSSDNANTPMEGLEKLIKG